MCRRCRMRLQQWRQCRLPSCMRSMIFGSQRAFGVPSGACSTVFGYQRVGSAVEALAVAVKVLPAAPAVLAASGAVADAAGACPYSREAAVACVAALVVNVERYCHQRQCYHHGALAWLVQPTGFQHTHTGASVSTVQCWCGRAGWLWIPHQCTARHHELLKALEQ